MQVTLVGFTRTLIIIGYVDLIAALFQDLLQLHFEVATTALTLVSTKKNWPG